MSFMERVNVVIALLTMFILGVSTGMLLAHHHIL